MSSAHTSGGRLSLLSYTHSLPPYSFWVGSWKHDNFPFHTPTVLSQCGCFYFTKNRCFDGVLADVKCHVRGSRHCRLRQFMTICTPAAPTHSHQGLIHYISFSPSIYPCSIALNLYLFALHLLISIVYLLFLCVFIMLLIYFVCCQVFLQFCPQR